MKFGAGRVNVGWGGGAKSEVKEKSGSRCKEEGAGASRLGGC